LGVVGVLRRRGLWVVLLVCVGAAGWGLWRLYGAPNRADLSAYWQLVAAVAAMVVTVVGLVRGSRADQTVADGGSELDWLANRLADTVRRQWTEAAAARGLLEPAPIAVRWRPANAVAGSAATATASGRFSPLPGLGKTGKMQLREGEVGDLHAVYGGLGSGRLVITGAPGSGKSGAALLLVLDALKHRSDVAAVDRVKVPVPVLFTLSSWNPRTQLVRDWVVSQLRQTYDGLFTGRRGARKAAQLIDEGKIMVILDGLDEITEQLRPVALQALSEQAIFRVIVLARTAEIAGAAKQEILDGATAVELQHVDPATAAAYLKRFQVDPTPPRWQELIDSLRTAPDSPLARALSNPLIITLVRDTYRTDESIEGLLNFCASSEHPSPEDIEDHLLDRVLPQAYSTRPGQLPPRYTVPTAHHTLALIADRMNRDNTRDLAWWRIPTWTHTLPRVLTIAIAIGLVTWLGLKSWLPRSVDTATFELEVVLTAGIGGMLGAWQANRRPLDTTPIRWRLILSSRMLLFVLATVFGYMFSFGFEKSISHSRIGLWFLFVMVFGFPVVLAIWLLIGLAIWLIGQAHDRMVLARWRSIHRHPFVVFVAGLGFGIVMPFWLGAVGGSSAIMYGLAFLGLLGLGLGLRLGLGSLGRGAVTPLTPLASWGQSRVVVLAGWLGSTSLVGGFLIWIGIAGWTILGVESDSYPGVPISLGLAFLSGLMLGLICPETWTTSLASVQLAIRHTTPIQLMRFLDDARARNVLRIVGPVYQFRHARLQDRLARTGSTTPAAKARSSSRDQAPTV